MQLHEIEPIHKLKKPKRVGRGGKRGTYSGHGIKGQRSRAGRRFKPIIRELIKKYPKLRGYKFKSKINHSPFPIGWVAQPFNKGCGKNQKSKITILNLEILEKKFNSAEKVNPEILLEKRIIRKIKGRIPLVKILGKGKLTKPLIIDGCKVSKSAKEKIEKAGGTVRM